MDPVGSLTRATAESPPAGADPRERALERTGRVGTTEGRSRSDVVVGGNRSDVSSETERAARPDLERAAPEVSISQEARDRFRASSQRDAQETAERALAEEEREQREQSAAVENAVPRFIAVRVGPAPVDDLSDPSRSAAEAGLRERAGLRVVDQVLSLPEPGQVAGSERPERTARPTPDSPVASEVPGLETRDAREAGREELRSERPVEPRLDESFSVVGRTGFSAARAEGVSVAAERERTAVEEAGRPGLSTRDLERAVSVAPQTGGVAPRETGRDGPAPSSESNARADAPRQTEGELTLSGPLEASAADSIVTRFLGEIEAEDPGPTPRPREVPGTRSLV